MKALFVFATACAAHPQWGHLDDPSRDAWQQPDEVIRAMALTPAMTVADVGAGTGYFTVRLARAVPEVDFAPSASHGPPAHMRLSSAQVVADLASAGLDATLSPVALPEQYLVEATRAPR